MTGRVLFYVQHLLGIGHLKRAATLARGMVDAGMDVTLVSGGEDVPVLDREGLRLVQLPAVRAADKTFKTLLDDGGRLVDDAWKAERSRRLIEIFDRVRPEVLIVELFPFGRRQMRFELMPLLEAARRRAAPPLILSSVRDILVEKEKSARNAEMVELALAWFDGVLVHGDPTLIPFDATFPEAGRLAGRLHYTGYVVDQAAAVGGDGGPGTGEVVVSTGGGAVSEPLVEAAMGARRLSSLADTPWRILVGHNLPEDRFRALQRAAPPGVTVERNRKDFVRLLANCRLSISQGGYNTVMEILATGARAVVVPYAGIEETEQTLRAGLLARRGVLEVVEESALSAEALARAVDRAIGRGRTDNREVNLAGASTTARLVAGLLAGKTPIGAAIATGIDL